MANAKAHCEVYATDLITSSEFSDLRQSIASDKERRNYNRMLDAEDVMHAQSGIRGRGAFSSARSSPSSGPVHGLREHV